MFIIKKFIKEAEEVNAIPVIVFFPNWKDFTDYQKDGKTVYSALYNSIRKWHPYSYDALDFFIPEFDKGAEIDLFFNSYRNGHYNPDGERIVAEGVSEILKEIQ